MDSEDRSTQKDTSSSAGASSLSEEWQRISSAPRDGTFVQLAFGIDVVTVGAYSRDDSDPHPWKFLDQQQRGVPIFNGARDDIYGPTHWKPLSTPPVTNPW